MEEERKEERQRRMEDVKEEAKRVRKERVRDRVDIKQRCGLERGRGGRGGRNDETDCLTR